MLVFPATEVVRHILKARQARADVNGIPRSYK
jgi:hypothetical protein